jgi:hypothetical protein
LTEERRISAIYVFKNGRCMVFDQHGEQMVEYCGWNEDMLPKRDDIKVYRGPIRRVEGKS